MQILTTMIVVLTAFNSAFAAPNPTPVTSCHKPTTTITTTPLRFGVCPVCIAPTSSCSAGEPTGPTPTPPHTTTESVSKGACTATVEVFNNPGCGNCATCTSAAVTATATATATGRQRFARQDFCIPTTTVTETVGPQTTEICACPAYTSTCTPGQPTAPPLPTTTLTEGCTETIVVGPGNCGNLCPTCQVVY